MSSALFQPFFLPGGPLAQSKIDACSRRAVNSIYSVLILFNPIHISEPETWQDVTSHNVSREILLCIAGTKFKKKFSP